MTTKQSLDALLGDVAAARGEIDRDNPSFIRLRAPGDHSGANVTIVTNDEGGMDHADVWDLAGNHVETVTTIKAVRTAINLD